MGLFGGNQKNEPLHYGEVYGIWNHLLMAKGCQSKYQLLTNHSGDQDLRQFLNDLLKNLIQPEIQQLETLLKENGTNPPPAPASRSVVDLESIPEGARFSDPEVATCVSHDIAQGLASASQIIGISLREDIARLFVKHHGELSLYGGRLLKLMKAKGWIVTPPLQQETPELTHV